MVNFKTAQVQGDKQKQNKSKVKTTKNKELRIIQITSRS